eukprot:1159001-Pelagomonas_calceolata.AAC.14
MPGFPFPPGFSCTLSQSPLHGPKKLDLVSHTDGRMLSIQGIHSLFAGSTADRYPSLVSAGDAGGKDWHHNACSIETGLTVRVPLQTGLMTLRRACSLTDRPYDAQACILPYRPAT